ncbi:MAG: serine O-acetyltransferase [Clostridia bacterium]|nr:serine O-acetyltransferase [Clostridia bacterium]
MFNNLKKDIAAVKANDPAARSSAEIFFLYSGLHALQWYRFAHWMWKHNRYFIARWASQHARRRTGIEIHPGAEIAHGVFIDHGMGVVIGETAVIGEGCVLYQGVTLGGTGKDKGKRHPTLGKNVMVGAGAKVLGPFTVGDNAKIAANSVVLSAIPPNSTAVGIPAKIVKMDGKRVDVKTDQIHVPDPVVQQLCRLEHRIYQLEQENEQ